MPITATEHREHTKLLADMVRELSKERKAGARLYRLYTLVFSTKHFKEWFREERAAFKRECERLDAKQAAAAVRRPLPFGPLGIAPARNRKPSTRPN